VRTKYAGTVGGDSVNGLDYNGRMADAKRGCSKSLDLGGA